MRCSSGMRLPGGILMLSYDDGGDDDDGKVEDELDEDAEGSDEVVGSTDEGGDEVVEGSLDNSWRNGAIPVPVEIYWSPLATIEASQNERLTITIRSQSYGLTAKVVMLPLKSVLSPYCKAKIILLDVSSGP